MTNDRGRTSSHPAAEAAPSAVRWLVVIYFCSGACSLIDEVVWVRLLKLTLGNTIYASSIVVSTFMGGLALGALIMGRYADRVRRRLRLYAVLEVAVTASALALPWALGLAEAAYGRVFVRWEESPAALIAVQVVVSAAILLVPTMLMGSTLPLLGRYVTALAERTGRRVGRLYALNMLGATLGCFLAGFVLIRTLGVMGTLYAAAGLNLLVAAGGWVLSRRHDTAETAPAHAAMPASASATAPAP
ncbi:MAG: fused MFS/spermidine synthase, partial [Planctomycetota bacterium]|nr:fused MFS/spermidine synthase [Planctomycetota bacterium]